MNLSIVLAAYNQCGNDSRPTGKHSLLAQTRKPDEVSIFDDCSTDDTVETVRRFAAQYMTPTQSTIRRIQKMKRIRGWRANLYAGISGRQRAM